MYNYDFLHYWARIHSKYYVPGLLLLLLTLLQWDTNIIVVSHCSFLFLTYCHDCLIFNTQFLTCLFGFKLEMNTNFFSS